VFSHIHSRYRTPARSNLIFMVVVSLLAMFVPARVAGEMTSIGTLLAFSLVCIGVLVTRKTMPSLPRAFKTPLVPLVPILGVLCCLGMMLFLPADTWIRLVVWMVIGFDVYSLYGVRHSRLAQGETGPRKGLPTLHVLGICGSFLCIVCGLWHQQSVGWGESKLLLILAAVFGLAHIAYFTNRLWRDASQHAK